MLLNSGEHSDLTVAQGQPTTPFGHVWIFGAHDFIGRRRTQSTDPDGSGGILGPFADTSTASPAMANPFSTSTTLGRRNMLRHERIPYMEGGAWQVWAGADAYTRSLMGVAKSFQLVEDPADGGGGTPTPIVVDMNTSVAEAYRPTMELAGLRLEDLLNTLSVFKTYRITHNMTSGGLIDGEYKFRARTTDGKKFHFREIAADNGLKLFGFTPTAASDPSVAYAAEHWSVRNLHTQGQVIFDLGAGTSHGWPGGLFSDEISYIVIEGFNGALGDPPLELTDPVGNMNPAHYYSYGYDCLRLRGSNNLDVISNDWHDPANFTLGTNMWTLIDGTRSVRPQVGLGVGWWTTRQRMLMVSNANPWEQLEPTGLPADILIVCVRTFPNTFSGNQWTRVGAAGTYHVASMRYLSLQWSFRGNLQGPITIGRVIADPGMYFERGVSANFGRGVVGGRRQFSFQSPATAQSSSRDAWIVEQALVRKVPDTASRSGYSVAEDVSHVVCWDAVADPGRYMTSAGAELTDEIGWPSGANAIYGPLSDVSVAEQDDNSVVISGTVTEASAGE